MLYETLEFAMQMHLDFLARFLMKRKALPSPNPNNSLSSFIAGTAEARESPAPV